MADSSMFKKMGNCLKLPVFLVSSSMSGMYMAISMYSMLGCVEIDLFYKQCLHPLARA